MAQTNIREVTGPVVSLPVTSGVTVLPGDLVYVTSGALSLADADSLSTPAEWIALEGAVGDGSKTIRAAKRCTVYDEDAVFTAGSLLYLHTDVTTGLLTKAARNLTHTRPAGVRDLRQAVGVAYTTKRAIVEMLAPKEVIVPLVVTRATSAGVLLDSGNFGGPSMDASGETCNLIGFLPENFLSVVKASLFVAAEAVVAATTADITITGHAGDATAHDAISADATLVNQALDVGGSADEIGVINLATGLDATNIVAPGHAIGVKLTSDQAGTDIMLALGGFIVCKVAA